MQEFLIYFNWLPVTAGVPNLFDPGPPCLDLDTEDLVTPKHFFTMIMMIILRFGLLLF